jgi:threonine dehydrogenase-like Zn-dependent dehydrogenase
MTGTRVYEHEDFAKAIQLLSTGAIPFQKLITDVYPLDRLEDGLKQMEKGGEVMKILVDCGR